jgi:hypothetical protein
MEQVAQLHHRATGQRGGFHRAHRAAGHLDPVGVRAVGAAGDRQATNRAERRQRLPPEAEAGDVQKVGAVDLGRGVTGERQWQVVRPHPASIVGHPDQRLAAMGDLHRDPCRAGIERVFHQFLDRAGGAFDDLTGRDPVDRGIVELADHGRAGAWRGVCWGRQGACHDT